MSRTLPLAVSLCLASCTSCGSRGPAPRPTAPRGPATSAPDELPPRPDGPARTWSPLGTNLDGPYDWSEAIPFIDGFHLSRPWTSAPALNAPDDSQPIAVDEHGWIRELAEHQIVRTGLYWDVSVVRGGRYVVRWQGRGRLETFGGAAGRVVQRGEQSMTVDWDAARDGAGFGIALVETDAVDPLRNIQVIPPGGVCRGAPTRFCEPGDACGCELFVDHHERQVFHPDFLATLESYSLLRFMNWQLTNDSQESAWSDRPRVQDARWSAHGIAPEVLIDLANRTHSNAWFCVPHRADDGYARELGRLVRARLDPELTARVELSNEVWNGIFEQWGYARDEGLRRGFAEDDGLAQIRWYARRSAEIWAAFDEGHGERSRVIHVLGTHVENPWVAEQMLEIADVREALDELAIAPYFGALLGPDSADAVLAEGGEGLLARLDAAIDPVLERVAQHVALAEPLGARVVAYEGGQHLVAVGGLEDNERVQEMLHACNRDPRMRTLYARYLAGWREAGGALFVHFVNLGGWGRYGSWGALEHPQQEVQSAPKWMALERFARTTRPWW